MVDHPSAIRVLADEARALLTRLRRVKSFALNETMVPAAALSLLAQTAIERQLAGGRRALRRRVNDYLGWLCGPGGRAASPAEAHRRFALLRLIFNDGLAQFDMFSQVVTQRSENEIGVWLSGLDSVAEEALRLPGYYEPPPLACYLDRGPGAAIRRVRTRLPGGDENPVALIRVPRERMIGSAIASSLIHEVGHQAAALLDLVPSLRAEIRPIHRRLEPTSAWNLFDRWISEIVADFWAVARLGIGATLGLMAVVSLPLRLHVPRQVQRPASGTLDPGQAELCHGPGPLPRPAVGPPGCTLGVVLPDRCPGTEGQGHPPSAREGHPRVRRFVDPPSSGGITRPGTGGGDATGGSAAASACGTLSVLEGRAALLRRASPTLVFAVVGQARADGRISPELEARVLAGLLTYWALTSNLDTSEICATRQPRPTRFTRREPLAIQHSR